MDILDLTHMKFESKEVAIQIIRLSSTLNNKTQSRTSWNQQFAEVKILTKDNTHTHMTTKAFLKRL